MNYRMVAFVLGRIFAIEACLMLFPLICAMLYGEWYLLPADVYKRQPLLLMCNGLSYTLMILMNSQEALYMTFQTERAFQYSTRMVM